MHIDILDAFLWLRLRQEFGYKVCVPVVGTKQLDNKVREIMFANTLKWGICNWGLYDHGISSQSADFMIYNFDNVGVSQFQCSQLSRLAFLCACLVVPWLLLLGVQD